MAKKCEEEWGERPRKVRQLMGSKYAIPAVLGFIEATWAGQRAQRKKQETEKRKSEMDKAWGLDEGRLEENE